MTDNDNKLLVSGPINVIRVEGNVHGVKKILYLFFDVHLGLFKQTHCDQDKFYDAVNYFVDNFKGSKDKISFFLEITDFVQRSKGLEKDDRQAQSIYQSKFFNMYMYRVRNFFSKYFRYDVEKNKIISDPRYSNIYFHFFDFRWAYLPVQQAFSDVSKILMENSSNKLRQTGNLVINMIDHIQKDYDFIFNTSQEDAKKILSQAPKLSSLQEFTKLSQDETLLVAQRYIYKFLYSYKDEKIKQIINKLIQEEVKPMYTKVLYHLNNFLKRAAMGIKIEQEAFKKNNSTMEYHCRDLLINGLSQEEEIILINDLLLHCTIAENYYMILYSYLIDCYFIRRFLDKDYSEKNIVYAGGAHTANHINILVKHFDFKITHYSYLKYDLETSMKKLKESNCEISTTLPLSDEESQCSDLTTFPKNFD
jgi:hypothetical protein